MSWLETFWNKLFPPESTPGLAADNFTPRAQIVLELARNESNRLHHNFVGTEHLLLGLIAMNQGVAVAVLDKLGLDLANARLEVEKIVGLGQEKEIIGRIPYPPRFKKVLVFAAEEARATNHAYVGTEHILLGILGEGDGVTARVLKSFSVDLEQTRQEILKELNPPNHDGQQGAGEQTHPPTAPVETAPNPVPLQAKTEQTKQEPTPETTANILTPRAQKALALARDESSRFRHNYVGTEHVLLGLIALNQGVAVTVLAKLGLNLENTRLAVEEIVGISPGQEIIGRIPYTPRVKRVLALAVKEAKTLNHAYVGTEHILLGLLREGEGPAIRLLLKFGVNPQQTYNEIHKELNPPNHEGQKGAGDQPLPPE